MRRWTRPRHAHSLPSHNVRIGQHYRNCVWTVKECQRNGYSVWVIIDITRAGVLWVKHAGIKDRHDLDWAIKTALEHLGIIADSGFAPPWMKGDGEEKITSTLVVAKFLLDLKAKVEQLFRDGQPSAAKNYLCEPRRVVRGMDEEIFLIEKHVSTARRLWARTMFPIWIPLSFLVNSLVDHSSAIDNAQIAFRYMQIGSTQSFEVVRQAEIYQVERQESLIASFSRQASSLGGFIKMAAALGYWPI